MNNNDPIINIEVEHHEFYDIYITPIVPAKSDDKVYANELITINNEPRTKFHAANNVLYCLYNIYHENITDSGKQYWSENVPYFESDMPIEDMRTITLIAKPDLPEKLDNIDYIYEELDKALDRYKERIDNNGNDESI